MEALAAMIVHLASMMAEIVEDHAVVVQEADNHEKAIGFARVVKIKTLHGEMNAIVAKSQKTMMVVQEEVEAVVVVVDEDHQEEEAAAVVSVNIKEIILN